MTGVVVGCGINVNQKKFDTSLPFATSIKAIIKQDLEIEPLFESLAKNIVTAVGLEQVDHGRYLDVLYKMNELCAFKTKEGTSFQGKISGVSTDGKLIVTHVNGDRKLYEEKTLVFTAFQH
jgi:biotin-(acetyl-CoA carboxylase) ligase